MADNSIFPTDASRAVVSTSSDPNYYRAKHMPGVSHKLKDLLDLSNDPESKYNYDWIDALSPELIRRMKFEESDLVPYAYDGSKPITTIAYELYGSTTLWYVIVYVNGFIHPDEIPYGSKMMVPTTKALRAKFSTERALVSQRGKTVQI